jgi:hypothetical protein
MTTAAQLRFGYHGEREKITMGFYSKSFAHSSDAPKTPRCTKGDSVAKYLPETKGATMKTIMSPELAASLARAWREHQKITPADPLPQESEPDIEFERRRAEEAQD